MLDFFFGWLVDLVIPLRVQLAFWAIVGGLLIAIFVWWHFA